jgi:hypothetical protein
MRKFPSFVPIALRRNRSSPSKGGRRLAAWTAALGAVALVGGVLQTASAQGLIGTTTTLESSSVDNTSLLNETVTYTAKVTAEPVVASGKVTFFEELEGVDQPITECTDVAVVAGEAECQQTYTSTGTHTISAAYTDDAEPKVYEDSSTTSDLTQTVKAASSTVLSPSDNSTVSGELVTYTATVSSDYTAATPSGSVTFKVDGGDIPDFDGNGSPDCVAVSLDTAHMATCPTKFAVGDGSYEITAVYLGDTSFAASTSNAINQAVGQAGTTTVVSSSPTQWRKGQPVTYTAAVAWNPPSTGFPAPTGTITFKHGTTTTICEKELVGSTEDCTYTHNSSGSQTITAEYSGDGNYVGSDDDITQVVAFYDVVATASSANATFTITSIDGAPRLSQYRLCVRYFGYNNVEDDWPAVTTPPRAERSGIHRFGINFNNKCNEFGWSSGSSDDMERLMDAPLGSDDFGFATKGTYEVSWFTCGNQDCTSNGVLIGTDKFDYDSWCPPNVGSFRQIGVWRTSRHKVRNSCYVDTANASGLDSHFDKDRSVSWKGWHNEFVARDYIGSYGAPSQGPLGANGNGWGSGWRRYVGVWVCDRYHHGKSELHPMFMAEEKTANGGIRRYLGGAHYSTKTPSISGTWKTYKC